MKRAVTVGLRRVCAGLLLLGLLPFACSALAAETAQLAKSSGGWFGVHVMDLAPESAAARGFGDGRGILISAVIPGSPAEQAGLRPGDIVLEIDGRRIIWFKSMIALVQSRPPGRKVEVSIARDGERLRTLVELGDREAAGTIVRSNEALDRSHKAGVEVYNAGRAAEAARVFADLADHGWSISRFALGFLYSEGVGLPLDKAKAATLYRQAAESGETSAQRNLALLYWTGDGIMRDLAHAYFWMTRAAAGGHEEAAEDQETIRGELSGGEAARAEAWLAYRSQEPTQAERRALEAVNTDAEPSARTAPAKAAAKPGASDRRAGPDSRVRQIQIMLDGLGYRPGPADGLMGRRTRSAIEQFERDRGLPVTGQVDDDLVASLRSASGQRPRAAVTDEDLDDLDDF